MSAHTQIRLASLTAAAYGALFVSGIVYRFQRTGSFHHLVDSLSRPLVWGTLLVAAIVTFGLWKRYAWAWWLALAAAIYQLFRIGEAWYEHGLARVPGVPTLIALVLLVVILVLLLPRRSRLGCNR
jgi:hypothetical protein